jgi:hypothetical protein
MEVANEEAVMGGPRPLRFRRIPMVVEAIQWNGQNTPVLDKWGANVTFWPGDPPNHSPRLIIEPAANSSRVNVMRVADAGDWIIKDETGEFYPCHPDIFDKTYERAG